MRKLLNKLIAAVSAAAVAIAGVNFGGIGGLNLTAAAETVGTFTVTGGENGTDYYYADGVLTIKSDTQITISAAPPQPTLS